MPMRNVEPTSRAKVAPPPRADAPAAPEPETSWDIFEAASEKSELRLTIERPAEIVRMANGDLGVKFLTAAEAPSKPTAPVAPPAPPATPPFDLARFEEMLHQELSDRGIQMNRSAFAGLVQKALVRKQSPSE